MVFDEKACLNYEPFGADDSDVKRLSDKFVATRAEHRCQICEMTIPSNSRVRALSEVNRDSHAMLTSYFCMGCCEAMAASWSDGGEAIEARYGIPKQANAISKQTREMLEFDEIGPRIGGEMRVWALTFLGREPGPDEKVLDIIAEAAARRQGDGP